jgi:hypothetical protein
MDGRTLATGLGIFSIGLGLMEIMHPRRISGKLGAHRADTLVKVYGYRELATGVGILGCRAMGRSAKPWIWARIAGDVLDLASLGAVTRVPGANKKGIASATAAVAGVTALDVLCAFMLDDEDEEDGEPMAVVGAVKEYLGRLTDGESSGRVLSGVRDRLSERYDRVSERAGRVGETVRRGVGRAARAVADRLED